MTAGPTTPVGNVASIVIANVILAERGWFLRPGPEVLAALRKLHGIGNDEFAERSTTEG